MTSQYWDAGQARAYHEFRYHFPEKTLAGKTISVAGGAVSRFGRSEAVARAVRFFLEPDNYITGQAMAVDGGLTLRRDRA